MDSQTKTIRYARAIRLGGKGSETLRSRCPDSVCVWPTRECINNVCPWWVESLYFMNCSFLAAECGEHTLAEVGTMMGLSRERIRQIEADALKKLQKRIEGEPHVYQQGVGKWEGPHSSPHSKHLGTNEIDFLYGLGLRDLGVEGR